MTKHITLTASAAALLAAGVPLERKDADPMDVVLREVKNLTTAVSDRLDKLEEGQEKIELKSEENSVFIRDLEQKNASRRYVGGGGGTDMTPGQQITSQRDELASLESKSGKVKLEVKDFIGSDIASAGALVSPDRDSNIVMLPKRRLTIRNLLGKGRTSSNSVEFMKQTGFVNAAAVVAEGTKKPQSNITFDLVDAKVRVIAHWVKASRQILDDAPQMETLIDGELRYGVALTEENQLLLGDGTGQNLHGLVPQATAYEVARNVAGDTRFDTLLHAIEQAEVAELPASGIILNTSDWYAMLGIKDGDGNYISGGPLANVPERIWRLPIVWTNAMSKGEFLVGAFETAATLYDREQTTVEFGYENDDFTKNLVTVLAEERLALAVKRPEAIIYGSFPTTGG
nr:phage major capsid protein [Brucella anthropi]